MSTCVGANIRATSSELQQDILPTRVNLSQVKSAIVGNMERVDRICLKSNVLTSTGLTYVGSPNILGNLIIISALESSRPRETSMGIQDTGELTKSTQCRKSVKSRKSRLPTQL